VNPESVLFLERAGSDALSVLDELATRLRADGADVTLLRSAERDDLYLIVARGAGAIDAPAPTRAWRFVPVA
jgi:hypothetical protein